MSDQTNEAQSAERSPARVEIRAARHAGFIDSIKHMSAPRQEELMEAFLEQDRRREVNVSELLVDRTGEGNGGQDSV